MEIKKIESLEKINSIINKFDEEFAPSLSSLVIDLSNYSKKIFDNAITIAMVENDDVLGFASFYCNDKESGIAFLSQIAVKKQYESNGIGTALLKECERIAKNHGMNKFRLEVYKNNLNGIKFYERNLYIFEKECSKDSRFMIKEI